MNLVLFCCFRVRGRGGCIDLVFVSIAVLYMELMPLFPGFVLLFCFYIFVVVLILVLVDIGRRLSCTPFVEKGCDQ